MEQRIFNSALAGLIHDIGKMEQRARVDPWKTAPGIDQEGQPVHATWTIYFIDNNLPKKYRAAALAGAYHHNPEKSPAEDKSLSILISLADKLSAGERADQIDKDKSPPQQMVSIFDRIQTSQDGQESHWHYLGLNPLQLDEQVIFPDRLLGKKETSNAYDRLCEIMRAAARQPIEYDQAYLENLLGAMQQTAWCVPSAYYHSIPDVSLYDHSRMTAALAVCLADIDTNILEELLASVRREFRGEASAQDVEVLNQPVALLVGGDISGIQKFIYTISSKGAARMLRGRSFYLQLLTEALLRYTLSKLGLPYTNVIYSGGGHFYLLAPLSAKDKISDLQQSITRKLLKHHGINLYLAMGYTQAPANSFRIGQFSRVWADMHASLAKNKQQRYGELGDDFYELVFKPPELGGNPDDTCAVCGEDNRSVMAWNEEQEEQTKICSLCQSFVDELGKPLVNSNFVALGHTKPVGVNTDTALGVLQAFGMDVHLVKDAQDKIDLIDVEHLTIWALADPPDNRWPEIGGTPAAHVLHYSVNHIPIAADKDVVKQINESISDADRKKEPARLNNTLTFNHLQALSQGIQRLGVLRMDVDNLGEIFTQGFVQKGTQSLENGQNLTTLARLSTLSFQISLFFEGWVKYLCENKPYKDLVYAVYSGGDDLFLIGPWHTIPELAQKINLDFVKYTSQNPALHLSGGMAFIGGKYPVYQAAEEASGELDQAKNLPGKNAFSFLNMPWKWTTFSSLAEKQARILHLVGSDKEREERMAGPQAIIQILRKLAKAEADKARRMNGRPVWGPWMWIGAYQLKRMAERYAKQGYKNLSNEIEKIQQELNANNYGEINQWGSAARWAQLKTRKPSKGKERI
jgi:CRISPR-associated protein Csm1